jgi:membrane associated rhomboid family serine protease
MGIYDRDYYRENSSYLGSFIKQGAVTKWLIGINVVCFLMQMLTKPEGQTSRLFSDGWFTNALILDVNAVFAGQIWRLFSYAFLHSTTDLTHLVFNMVLLWWFGQLVEGEMSKREYVAFYLCAAGLSGVAYVFAALAGFHGVRIPTGDGTYIIYARCLGASGCVTAVLVLAAFYAPRMVIYFMFVIPMPIWGFIVLSVGIDLYRLNDPSSNVAASAHLGGAAFGYLYHKLHWHLTSLFAFAGTKQTAKPKLRIVREEDDSPLDHARKPSQPVKSGVPNEQLEARVDDILEKIQKVGMDGLTDEERKVLVEASEALKRKRT